MEQLKKLTLAFLGFTLLTSPAFAESGGYLIYNPSPIASHAKFELSEDGSITITVEGPITVDKIDYAIATLKRIREIVEETEDKPGTTESEKEDVSQSWMTGPSVYSMPVLH
jgi:hypothetical protein